MRESEEEEEEGGEWGVERARVLFLYAQVQKEGVREEGRAAGCGVALSPRRTEKKETTGKKKGVWVGFTTALLHTYNSSKGHAHTHTHATGARTGIKTQNGHGRA